MDPKTKSLVFRDSKLKSEEQSGQIECRVIQNDGRPANYVLLTALKNIFQKQLPKMPREYITRLIYDRTHKSLLILRPASGEEQKKNSALNLESGLDNEVKEVLKMVVVGGITYKGFIDRGFIEIVFCAISSTEQVKGYGSFLMNHMKEQARKEGPLVQHFLTYADNYAVGYFQKQGFTKDITLDRLIWVGYIKDYDGGTLMQCTMVPGIDYLNVYSQLHQQKLSLLRIIDSKISCSRVYPGIPKTSTPTPLRKPSDIPGVIEAGWSEELAQLARNLAAQASVQDQRTCLYLVLKPLLNDLIHHPASWPFRKPVDPNEVPDYLSVITLPMDLSTMSKRLESEHYKSISEFTADVKLIADNCRKYNDPDTTYYKNANILENFYFEKLKVRELK